MTHFAESLHAHLAARPPSVVAEWEARPAAVLIPLFFDAGQWHVLLTERTDLVEDHKGQVAFPGGRVDAQDADRVATALREAEEEVGLKREHVTVLGQIDELLTVTQYRITPVVGVFPWPYAFTLQKTELSEVFSVPLRWLAEPANLEVRQRHPLIPGRPIDVYYFHYAGHTIWGVTARIILNLVNIAGPLLTAEG
jgi:8-oxo-dGTP pyrophosphatase MutT (NUDIX family)